MEILNKIHEFIVSNDIENAYESIVENEKLYKNNSTYWNLRGMLCFKIQEYNLAINCYKKSIYIQDNCLDAYFNLAYIYKLIGENIKSVLYGAIGLRHTEDIEFINDINDLYSEEVMCKEYINLLEDIKLNLSLIHI